MCGIAGILHFDLSERVDASRLARMRDVLRHRGPDGEGLFVDEGIGLAHRRLAIIDVAAGVQPMANEDGRIWITFNGEIYNHQKLRAPLEAAGHRYRTQCDTETIVHLYEDEGARTVERLEGMFAFAIWDGRARRLLLARDRLGIKPLYYTMTGRALIFASEIKALLESGLVRPRFNESVLSEYLANGFVAGEETFFKDVRKLMPGHVLTWSRDEGIRLQRYWQPPEPASMPPSPVKSASDLRELLEGAVDRHLMSDVPLGVFLSGGLDSSALAAMVARKRTTPIKTFAVGFADKATSELPYARLVASHIGADHHEITIDPKSYFESLPQLVWHEDEPIAFPSSVPLNFVARLASQHVKVVLTGEGADEIFLGYNRYRVTHWNARLGHLYRAGTTAGVRAAARAALEKLPARFARAGRRTFLGCDADPRQLYFENFSIIGSARQASLVRRRDLLAVDPFASQWQCFEAGHGSLLDRMGRTDLQTYLVELLMKQDQMSMAASIESRVPYLDDQVVSQVASMPGTSRLPGWETKTLLKAAVRDLVPPEILTRKKMGFPVPLGDWLRGEYWPVVDNFVLGRRAQTRGWFDAAALSAMANEHREGRASHTHALWLLINLEVWSRLHCDGEPAADIARALLGKREQTFHANPLGKNGRSLAADVRWPGPQLADPVRTVAAPFRDRHHDAR
jgi:asparagine synthase (glutamine-hydrolysing)